MSLFIRFTRHHCNIHVGYMIIALHQRTLILITKEKDNLKQCIVYLLIGIVYFTSNDQDDIIVVLLLK